MLNHYLNKPIINPETILRGYDIDGVLSNGVIPVKPYVIISGRTFEEYDFFCRDLASQAPLYIRGSGPVGARFQSGYFKAGMIDLLGVTEFHEDDDVQIAIIKSLCRNVEIIKY